MSALRRIFCLLIAVIIAVSAFPLLPEVSAETTVRNRKLVSIVYDDSGSMAGEKWEYTNYAMQCFAAMLNSEDTLDITYMSRYTKGATSVDIKDHNNAVKTIRKHDSSGSTPAESIDTAFKALKSHNDTNPNSQYWLVVMTDGEMSGNEPPEDKINRYADEVMPNGTEPHIIYMTICDTENKFTPTFHKSNVEVRSPQTAQEITKVISDIACHISGRYEVAASDIRLLDSRTVEVSTKLPLTRIGILIQRSTAKIDNITGAGNATLKQEYSVPVELPLRYDVLPQDEVATLRGNISLFRATSGNIAPGTYTIRLTEDVKKEDLVIMFEPAFELRIELTCGGTKVDDISTLVANDIVDIDAILYEIGTDNPIAMSDLPSGAQERLELLENGSTASSVSGLKMTGVTLKEAETRIEAELKIPGFFTVTDTVTFSPIDVSLTNITAELYYDGSRRLTDSNGNPDPENVVYVTSLATNDTGIRFTLFTQYGPIDKNRALKLQDEFTQALKLDFSNYKVTVCDDGTYIVAPTATLMPAFLFWLNHRGDSTIGVDLHGLTAEDTICFKMGDWIFALLNMFWWVFLILLLLYLLYWLFRKPHFKGDKSLRVYTATKQGAPYTQNYSYSKTPHYLSASGPINFFGLRGMRVRVGTFYVRKTAGSYRIENVKKMYVSTGTAYPCQNKGVSPHPKNYEPFSDTIYVSNGTNQFYKITFTKK